MPFRLASLLAALFTLVAVGSLAGVADAAPIPAGSTAILSGDGSLFSPLPAPVADSGVGPESVSGDGRFVAFSSFADGLSAEDDDSVENVYVKDMATGAVTLVSRQSGAAGAPSTGDCFDPAISSDGMHVAFACVSALDPGADANNTTDVYERDLTNDQTILVSRQSTAAGGAVGDRDSAVPSLSRHGDLVAFVSDAGNLSATDFRAVYVRDLAHGTTTLVSVANDGSLPNNSSFGASISDSGDRVAFSSDASNLVAGDDNGTEDVFVRSLNGSGSTELVSRQNGADGGKPGNAFSDAPVISGNGEVVAFESGATNFDSRDKSSDTDVYSHSLVDNSTHLVDAVPGAKLAAGALDATIDDHGDVIGFLSIPDESLGPAEAARRAARTLRPGFDRRAAEQPLLPAVAQRGGGTRGVAAGIGGAEVDVESGGATHLVSRAPAGFFFVNGSPAISGDAGQVAYRAPGTQVGQDAPGVATLAIQDLASNGVRPVSRPAAGAFDNAGGESDSPSVSADGRFVAFVTSAPGLGVPADAFREVVVRDTATGDVTLVSRADGPDGAPLPGLNEEPSISADGTRVAFSQTVAGQTELIWVRDLRTGSTILASRRSGADGLEADGDSFSPSISADGTRVAFTSVAKNLSPADTKTDDDIYVRDLTANQTILASVGTSGQKGNDDSRSPSLSADGRHVAFASFATNLGDGDTDPRADIHVRDLDAGTTRLASVSSGGVKGDASSEDPSISGDGSRVAFDSSASNFGISSPDAQIWVHDFASGATVLASPAAGAPGAPGDDDSFVPRISADGNFVGFISFARNLVPDAGVSREEVYRRDLGANITSLVSRASGAAGGVADQFADGGALTAHGECVTFESLGGLAGPVAGAGDFDQVYMRAFAADCGRPPTPGGSGGPSPAPPAHDTTAPVLRSVSLSRPRFRVAKGRTSVAARRRGKPAGRGTVLRFSLSESARLTIVIDRRHGRRRFRHVATFTRFRVRAGRGHVTLTGRIGRRRMAPGRYRLTLSARDAAGNRSKAVQLGFTILRG